MKTLATQTLIKQELSLEDFPECLQIGSVLQFEVIVLTASEIAQQKSDENDDVNNRSQRERASYICDRLVFLDVID